MDSDNNRLVEEIIQNLPHPPQIALQIIQSIEDENFNFAKLSSLMRSDPAFAAVVLKKANRLLKASEKDLAGSIERATEVLGFDRLREVALSISVFEVIDLKKKKVDFDIAKFWKESLTTALAAQILCANNGIAKIDPGVGFAAGMLINFGKLFLAMYFGSFYTYEIKKTEDRITSSNLLKLERNLFKSNLDHCQFGKLLAEKFEFPRLLVDAIYFHHDYDNLDEHTELFNKVIILARIIQKLVFAAPGSQAAIATAKLVRDMKMHLDISEEMTHRIIDNLIDQVPKHARLYDLNVGIPHADLLKRMVNVKLKVAQEASYSPEYHQFISQPEKFLPRSIALNLKELKNTFDPQGQFQKTANLLDQLFSIYGVMSVILLEYNGQQDSEPYQWFQNNRYRSMTMVNWIELLNRFYHYEQTVNFTYVFKEFRRMKDTMDKVWETHPLRNLLFNLKNTIGNEKYYHRYEELNYILQELLNQCFAFFYGYFFYITDTKITRDGNIYTVTKWKGVKSATELENQRIQSHQQLIQETDFYYFDEAQTRIVSMFPYLIRDKNPKNNQYAPYVFYQFDLQKKNYIYHPLFEGVPIKKHRDSFAKQEGPDGKIIKLD